MVKGAGLPSGHGRGQPARTGRLPVGLAEEPADPCLPPDEYPRRAAMVTVMVRQRVGVPAGGGRVGIQLGSPVVRGHSGQLVHCIVHPLTGCFARCHGGPSPSSLVRMRYGQGYS